MSTQIPQQAEHALMIEKVKAELAAAIPGSPEALNFSNQLQHLLLASLPNEVTAA
jgi:hypothetical protein